MENNENNNIENMIPNEVKSTDKKKKSIIIIAVIVIAIILIVVVVFATKNMKNNSNNANGQNGNNTQVKKNTNENVVGDKEINGILFTDIQCTFDGTMSLLNYKIVNRTDKTINLKEYQLIIKDKTGNLLATIEPSLDQEIAPNESYDTGNAINIDLTEAYSIEIKLDNNQN